MANVEGLNGDFRARLNALIQASGGRIKIGSGFRTHEEQKRLYAQKPKLAAKPGTSNHEKGLAGDLVFADAATQKWAHDNAARFGLKFPMLSRAKGKKYEPWHVEPAGAPSNSYAGGSVRAAERTQADAQQAAAEGRAQAAAGAPDVDQALFTYEGQMANLAGILMTAGDVETEVSHG